MTDDVIRDTGSLDGQEPDLTQQVKAVAAEPVPAAGWTGHVGVALAQPEPGRTMEIAAEAGQSYRFDIAPADVAISAEGGDLVFTFEDGGRIIFLKVAELAEDEAPSFLMDGAEVPAYDLLASQDVALTEDEGAVVEALETAAGETALESGGVGEFREPGISVIGLLSGQGVIAPTALQFGLINPETGLAASEASAPGASISLAAAGELDGVQVKEDSGFAAGNLLALEAEASGGVLSSIVISGLNQASGWTFDSSGLISVEGVVIIDNVAVDGTIIIELTGLDLTSYSGQLAVMPPEDSDQDLGSITATVTAVSLEDPSVTTSSSDSAKVTVDAVLDHFADVDSSGPVNAEESAQAQSLGLGLNLTLAQAGFTYSGSGGGDGDGSELHQVTLVLDAPLPEGASLSTTGGSITQLSDTEFLVSGEDLQAAVGGLQVTLPGGYEGTISGTLVTDSREANTPEGSLPPSGTEGDLSDNSVGDQTSFSVTVEGKVAAPEVAISLAGDADFIKEDSRDNPLQISAAVGDSSDELASLTVTFPGFDAGELDLGALSGDPRIADVTLDQSAGGLTLVITFVPGVESFSGELLFDAPQADGDADISGITVSATAQDKTDGSLTASDDASLDVQVDAVLDRQAHVTQTAVPTGKESPDAQIIGLNLDFSLEDAGFAGSGAGGVDDDGSEAVTSVIVTLTAGGLVFDGSEPAGAVLHNNGDGSYTLTVASQADLEAAVEALAVRVHGGFEGIVSGHILTTTVEANTPAGALPESGAEPDLGDNTREGSFYFSFEVEGHAAPPHISVEVGGDHDFIKEDGTGNSIEFSVSVADGSDRLTEISIELPNFTPGDVDITALEADPAVLNVSLGFSNDVTSIQVVLAEDVESFSSFILFDVPAEDSDIDLSGIIVKAQAVDKSDPSLTSSAESSLDIEVDAVLDRFADLSGNHGESGSVVVESEAVDAQTINLDLTLNFSDAGFYRSGDGGPDSDGSELHEVVLILSEPLAEGVGLTSAAGEVSATADPLMFTVSGADLAAAVEGLQVTLPPGFNGTIEGRLVSTSTEANTPSGSLPASGSERDLNDNSVSDHVTFSVAVEGAVSAPQAMIYLLGDAATIKEDSAGNPVEVNLSTGDASDQLASMTIELPGLTPQDLDLTEIAGHPDVAELSTDSAGGTTSVVVSFVDGVESFSATFLLDAPAEDSDVDLTGITLTAVAQDKLDPLLTAQGGGALEITVDAVLDDVLDVSAAGQTIDGVVNHGSDPQTSLGLSSVLAAAPFALSGAGGSDGDGSELVTVTITVSGGAELVFDTSGAPGIVAVQEQEDTWVFNGTTADHWDAVLGSAAVVPAVNATDPVTVTVNTTTSESNTPAGSLPGGGAEPDPGDNAVSDDQITLTITFDTVESDLAGAVVLAEDGLAMQHDGVLSPVAAGEILLADIFTPGDDEVLTSLTIGGLPDGASLSINGTALSDGVALTAEQLQDFLDGTAIEVLPPADGDLDFTLTFSAGVQDLSSTAEGEVSGEVEVSVDAVADLPDGTGAEVTTSGVAYVIAGASNQNGGGNATVLYAIDLDAGAVSELGVVDADGNTTHSVEAIAADAFETGASPVLYAFSSAGLLKITVNSPLQPNDTEVLNPDLPNPSNAGATFANGQLYYVTQSGNNSDIFLIDTGTGELTFLGETPSGVALSGLAFDPLSQTFYGVDEAGNASFLYSFTLVDLNAADGRSVSVINEGQIVAFDPAGDQNVTNFDIGSIAISGAGELTVIDRLGGLVVEVDSDSPGDSLVVTTITNSDVTSSGIFNLTIGGSDLNVVRSGDQFGVRLSATFGSDVRDGSEQHYFLVALPSGFTVPADLLALDSISLVTVAGDLAGVADGDYVKVEVDNSLLEPDQVFSTQIFLLAPDAGEDGGPGLAFEDLAVYAVSAENDLSGVEGSLDNNIAASGALDLEIRIFEGDSLLQGAASADELVGGSGDELLLGEAGDDGLSGGAGDDFLIGGQGDDLLDGGLGADSFIYGSVLDGNDVIENFSAAEDTINLDRLFDSLGVDSEDRAGRLQVQQKGDDSEITIDGLTEFSIVVADIDANDLILGTNIVIDEG